MIETKVSVLGARGFAASHLLSWQRTDVDLYIYDRDRKVLEDIGSKYGTSRGFDNMDEAIAAADIVDIILPHNMHAGVAKKAMKEGKHVLLEKPIATELADAEEMIRTAKEMRVKFMVAEQMYFDRSARWISESIRNGVIGRPLAILVRDQRFYERTGWRTKAEFMGGGALVDGGIHYLHAMLNFGGEYSEVKSYASKGASTLEEQDTFLALIRFDSGAIGSLFYCWSYREPPRPPAFEIIGTEASIVEDLDTRPSVGFTEKGGKRYIFGFPKLNGRLVDVGAVDVFDDEINGFLKSVENDTEVPMDPSLALRDLKSVKDIFASSARQ